MTTQLTEQERAAIKKEAKALYDEIMAAGEKVNADRVFAICSDAYEVGFLNTGVFIPSFDAAQEAFREGFGRLERQETQEPKEFRIAVLAPNVAMITELVNVTAYAKDGTTSTSDFTHTFVFAKIEGEWKIVHLHQSVPILPQTT